MYKKNAINIFNLGVVSARLPDSPIIATGGDSIYTYNDGGIDYRVHVFTNSGNFDVTYVQGGVGVEYVIVAGGGAGGGASPTRGGGGGGAGGVLQNLGGSQLAVSVQSYPIVVGAGGAAVVGNIAAPNGDNSSAFGLTAIGGGGGAYSGKGVSGGSGGGSVDNGGKAAAIAGQGMDGGNSDHPSKAGGGGGYSVAGEAGILLVDPKTNGQGGDGFDASSFIGTSIGDSGWFAGGGGGGNRANNANTPSQGGGGAGGRNFATVAPQAGTANTGGGGGGATEGSIRVGGGSGIVVIRYPLTV